MATPDVPPEKYRTFLELPVFTRRWDALGLSEADRLALQAVLMADPDQGRVVKGTGGLRKTRFAPPSWSNAGKSGSARVYYAHLPNFGVLVLVIAFAKGEADDIGADQQKALAQAIKTVRAALQDRAKKRRGKS